LDETGTPGFEKENPHTYMVYMVIGEGDEFEDTIVAGFLLTHAPAELFGLVSILNSSNTYVHGVPF